ncbi:MAG: MGMT family protein [Candidatus Pacearchaeota archaeon]
MKNREKVFNELCYKILSEVPRGKVTTYKEIAKVLKTKAYRRVGRAMNKNPYAPLVPCHRVVNSNGFVGGFVSGTKNKIKLLRREGIKIDKFGRINLIKYLYRFSKSKLILF